MTSHSLVVTGFEPFPGVPENPTETLVRSLADALHPVLCDAHGLIVPTRYGDAPDALRDILADAPRALIMTGYSRRAPGLVLESRATNQCKADLVDAGGFLPLASEPFHHIPARCDVAALERAVRAEGLPCVLSEDAGEYVCNHLYYQTLSALDAAGLATRALFLHLPAISGTPLAENSEAALTLEQMQHGLAALAHALLDG